MKKHKKTTQIVDSTTIKSMDEFQKRYFPKDVGNKCIHCGSKVNKDGRSIGEVNLWWPTNSL